MTPMITKSQVLKHFGSVAKTAEFFGIEPSAVYQWKEKIPRERELELMLRKPADFGMQPAPAEASASMT
jgi:uncharacterized protein involved in tolerance to divalent cations